MNETATEIMAAAASGAPRISVSIADRIDDVFYIQREIWHNVSPKLGSSKSYNRFEYV